MSSNKSSPEVLSAERAMTILENIRRDTAGSDTSTDSSSSSDLGQLEGLSTEMSIGMLERLSAEANQWKEWLLEDSSDSSGSSNRSRSRNNNNNRSVTNEAEYQSQGHSESQIQSELDQDQDLRTIRNLEGQDGTTLPGNLRDQSGDPAPDIPQGEGPEVPEVLSEDSKDSKFLHCFADSETDEHDLENTSEQDHDGFHSDSELSEKDKWPCHQCGNPTSAVSRYCLHCFQIRRNWLPKRKKPAKINNKRKYQSETSDSEEQNSGNNNSGNSGEEPLKAGAPFRREIDHEFRIPESKRLKIEESKEDLDLKLELKLKMKTESRKENLEKNLICGICCVREKDAAFVHDQIAHRCCCFPCADRILKMTGKCPICRERILRVVKMVVV